MKTKLLSVAAVILLSIGVSAQEKNTVKQEIKKDAKAVENGVKDGAEWTATTAKKGVKATKKGVKKSTKWTKKAVKNTGKAIDVGYKDTKDYVRKETK